MEQLNFLIVFIEGIISFFSPCILPILPLYFSYLSGSAKIVNSDGTIFYKQSKIFLYTFFFVFGVCSSFFILGLSVSVIGHFFDQSKYIIAILSGILVILFGLSQLNIINIPFLQQEKKIHAKLQLKNLSLLATFILGFTFSFAWTPCVGPILSSVLLLVANTSFWIGFLYLLLYTLGFILPFLLLGLFTTPLLNLLKRKQVILKYTLKVAGVLLLIIGSMLIYQNAISFFKTFEGKEVKEVNEILFYDQFDLAHKVSSYKGKVVIISFIDRFCSGCKQEKPLLKEIYDTYQNEDIVLIGVIQQKSDNLLAIKDYLEKEDYLFPVLVDRKQILENAYDIQNYPTTIFLNEDGEVSSSVIGTLTKNSFVNEMKKLDSNFKFK